MLENLLHYSMNWISNLVACHTSSNKSPRCGVVRLVTMCCSLKLALSSAQNKMHISKLQIKDAVKDYKSVTRVVTCQV